MNLTTLLLSVLCAKSALALIEMSGFHCMMRHSMRMNRRVHGPPQKSEPPFEFHFLDSDGHKTSYYEPGKIYTVRLVGFVHYRGLLLQSRLTNENGFLLGSLKGGRFIETPAWKSYGIRLQECDLRMSTADSVTHADDSRKFVTQLEWTSDKDVGAIQFMLTIAEEDEVYWERWRPRSGFIQPSSLRGKKITIINEVFTDEQAAMRLAEKKRHFEELLHTFYASNLTYDGVSPLTRPSPSTRQPVHRQVDSVDNRSKPPNSVAAVSTRQPTATTQFVQERESLKDVMRLFKSDFDELTRESRTSIPASTIHQLSGKALEHSAEFPPPSSLLRRPISQAITNTQLSVPISADSDLKSVGTLKTASIQKPVLCSNNVCLNGGTCVKDRREKEGYRCECAQGWTGSKCDEIDHCADHDCVSGECINNNDNYTCECLPNFAGQFCTRNCGVDFCKHNGSCVEKHGGELGCDCPAGSAGKRCEKGVLYVKRSIAISKADAEDQHVMNGFLTIRNHPDETQLVALTSVSNSGLIMIEEGELRGSSIIFKPHYRVSHPLVANKMPREMSRSFLKNGEKLLQSVSKKSVDGKNEHISKHYKKIVNIEFL
ncbi:Protein eyes shut [Toxocara canis]|uniref:Protein eyes shut n=2 Tax=Toxocara canis TaxID=6265 RepID=A0A0B2VPJ8_TOXCA|nr:Protein eyes shut [Toxocara canis]